MRIAVGELQGANCSPTNFHMKGANQNAKRLDQCHGPQTTPNATPKRPITAKRQRMWSEIANSVLTDSGDEGRAIREANAAVAKDFAKSIKA